MAFSQGPTFQWVKPFEGEPGFGSAIGIEKDAQGNLFVLGLYDGAQVILDPSATNGVAGDYSIDGRKLYIAKFSNNGALIWHKSIEGNSNQYSYIVDANDLKLGSDGSILICGSYRGLCDFDPSITGEYIVDGGLVESTFILKLDVDGNFDWVRLLSPDETHPLSAGFKFSVGGMELDLDGNVYLAGSVLGNWDFDPDPVDTNFVNMQYPFGYDGFLLKLSSDGDFVWKQIFGSSGEFHPDRANMIKRGLDNDLYFGCAYYDSIHVTVAGQDVLLNHPPGIYNDDVDFFMAKMDTSGQFEWVTRLVGNGGQFISDIEVDSNGEIYACGSFTGSVTLSPFVSGTYVSSQYNSASGLLLPDGLLIKYNSNGDPIYGTVLSSPDSEIFSEIEIDDENVYLGGAIGDSLYIGTDYIGYSEIPSGFYYDDRHGAVLKFSKSGDTKWVQRFESTGSSFLRDLLIDGNAIYSAGSFSGEVDFNTNINNFELVNTGAWFNSYGFLHKMIFTADSLDYADFSIFPNPTSGTVSLFIEDYQGLEVSVNDVQGRLINKIELESKLTVIDLISQASGVYFLVLNNGTEKEVKKVIKE